jgi:hypothetical protein
LCSGAACVGPRALVLIALVSSHDGSLLEFS